MPVYGYECTRCKATFEVTQRMSDAPLKEHDDCGGELRKLVFPVGIAFKGSGFHVNDYARKSSTVAGKSEPEKAPVAAPAKPETPPTATPAPSTPAKTTE